VRRAELGILRGWGDGVINSCVREGSGGKG